MLFDELDRLFEVCNAGRFGALMSGRYKVVDCMLVIVEEGMNV
jgi:hypothetical protein